MRAVLGRLLREDGRSHLVWLLGILYAVPILLGRLLLSLGFLEGPAGVLEIQVLIFGLLLPLVLVGRPMLRAAARRERGETDFLRIQEGGTRSYEVGCLLGETAAPLGAGLLVALGDLLLPGLPVRFQLVFWGLSLGLVVILVVLGVVLSNLFTERLSALVGLVVVWLTLTFFYDAGLVVLVTLGVPPAFTAPLSLMNPLGLYRHSFYALVAGTGPAVTGSLPSLPALTIGWLLWGTLPFPAALSFLRP